MTDELYQAIIIDHDRNPRHHGTLAGATHSATIDNPLCGDVVTIQLALDGDTIRAAAFECKGCALARAAGSIVATRAAGMTTGALRALATEFEQFVREPSDAPIPADLGELAAFAGVRKVRSRRTCATLALKAAVAALG